MLSHVTQVLPFLRGNICSSMLASGEHVMCEILYAFVLVPMLQHRQKLETL